jgi:hypothetical protein
MSAKVNSVTLSEPLAVFHKSSWHIFRQFGVKYKNEYDTTALKKVFKDTFPGKEIPTTKARILGYLATKNLIERDTSVVQNSMVVNNKNTVLILLDPPMSPEQILIKAKVSAEKKVEKTKKLHKDAIKREQTVVDDGSDAEDNTTSESAKKKNMKRKEKAKSEFTEKELHDLKVLGMQTKQAAQSVNRLNAVSEKITAEIGGMKGNDIFKAWAQIHALEKKAAQISKLDSDTFASKATSWFVSSERLQEESIKRTTLLSTYDFGTDSKTIVSTFNVSQVNDNVTTPEKLKPLLLAAAFDGSAAGIISVYNKAEELTVGKDVFSVKTKNGMDILSYLMLSQSSRHIDAYVQLLNRDRESETPVLDRFRTTFAHGKKPVFIRLIQAHIRIAAKFMTEDWTVDMNRNQLVREKVLRAFFIDIAKDLVEKPEMKFQIKRKKDALAFLKTQIITGKTVHNFLTFTFASGSAWTTNYLLGQLKRGNMETASNNGNGAEYTKVYCLNDNSLVLILHALMVRDPITVNWMTALLEGFDKEGITRAGDYDTWDSYKDMVKGARGDQVWGNFSMLTAWKFLFGGPDNEKGHVFKAKEINLFQAAYYNQIASLPYLLTSGVFPTGEGDWIGKYAMKIINSLRTRKVNELKRRNAKSGDDVKDDAVAHKGNSGTIATMTELGAFGRHLMIASNTKAVNLFQAAVSTRNLSLLTSMARDPSFEMGVRIADIDNIIRPISAEGLEDKSIEIDMLLEAIRTIRAQVNSEMNHLRSNLGSSSDSYNKASDTRQAIVRRRTNFTTNDGGEDEKSMIEIRMMDSKGKVTGSTNSMMTEVVDGIIDSFVAVRIQAEELADGQTDKKVNQAITQIYKGATLMLRDALGPVLNGECTRLSLVGANESINTQADKMIKSLKSSQNNSGLGEIPANNLVEDIRTALITYLKTLVDLYLSIDNRDIPNKKDMQSLCGYLMETMGETIAQYSTVNTKAGTNLMTLSNIIASSKKAPRDND